MEREESKWYLLNEEFWGEMLIYLEHLGREKRDVHGGTGGQI